MIACSRLLFLSILLLGPLALRSEEPTPEHRCEERLKKVYQAIQAYRKDHKELPFYLRELHPKYLPNEEDTICPKTKDADGLYSYEFSMDRLDAPLCITQREWKQLQMALAGGRVPIVRCHKHYFFKSLNIDFEGKFYISPLSWEDHPDLTAKVPSRELSASSLVKRFHVNIPYLSAEEAVNQASTPEAKALIQKVDSKFLQKDDSCVLSSYAVVASAFTGRSALNYYEACCDHFGIPYKNARDAESKYIARFFEEGERQKLNSGYEINLFLHEKSEQPAFLEARQTFDSRFYKHSKDHLKEIEKALKSGRAILNITFELDPAFHSVTALHDGKRFLVKDTRYDGFYHVASLHELGALRDCVLSVLKAPGKPE